MPDHRFPPDFFPAIVAHRGASSTMPENTLASFEESIRLGARIVEFDVRLARDGVAVVMHDPRVERTTDGTGAVHELTSTELAGLNAGLSDARQPVPRLADVLDLLSGRAGVAIEIKNLPGEPGFQAEGETVVEVTHREIERGGFDGPVLLISFNPRSIAASKAIAPTVPTGFLTTDLVPPRDALEHVRQEGHEMVLPAVTSLLAAGDAFIEDVHTAGLRVGTWTVDDPEQVRALADREVDAIATNNPAMALAALGRD
jgi:glycerophosphoryl diester phosphodiesterase